VFAVLEGANLCIATSGPYERGSHIVDPHSRRPPTGLLSITVVGSSAGSSLATVDAFATAAFAMGVPGVSWVAGLADLGVCAVTEDLHASYDEAFRLRRVA
jgi:thiamine biosynthesis lipoprotein